MPRDKFFKLFSSEVLYHFLIFLILLLLQVAYIIYEDHSSWFWHTESVNIAKSLVSEKGYANPFLYETGDTSWILPLIPLLYAAVFALFGTNTIITYLILGILGKLLIAASLFFLQKAFDKYEINYNRFLLFFIFFSYFVILTQYHIRIIYDKELFYFFTSLILYYSYDLIYHSKIKGLLILSFLIPLSLANLAIPFVSFFGFLFVFWLIKKIYHINPIGLTSELKFKHFLLAGFVFLVSVSIWTTRNYLTFNTFVLSKSNSWFEFYMSNIVDKKGILYSSTWRKEHPMENEKLCNTINEYGEIQWLEQFEDKGKQYLKLNRLQYLKKAKNRLINIFLFTDYRDDFVGSDFLTNLDESEKQVLEREKIIMRNRYLTINYDKDEFLSKIKYLSLKPETKTNLYTDWQKAKNRFYKDKFSPTWVFFGFTRATLPLLAMIVLIILTFMKIFKHPVFLGILLILYISHFIPFIVISHEIRYQQFVIILQITLVYLALQEVIKYLKLDNIVPVLKFKTL